VAKNSAFKSINPDFKLKDIFDEIVQGFLKPGIIRQGKTYGGPARIVNRDVPSDQLSGIN